MTKTMFVFIKDRNLIEIKQHSRIAKAAQTKSMSKNEIFLKIVHSGTIVKTFYPTECNSPELR